MSDRLSKIETLWSLVRHANDRQSAQSQSAQQQLLERYRTAIHRYLLAALRDENAADEVFQELSLKLVRGDFHTADPDKGRFRVFIKTCLHHMIVDYHRLQQKLNRTAEIPPHFEPAVEEEFVQRWREEILLQAWTDLESLEEESGKPWHTTLRVRIDHPEWKATQLAAIVAEKTGKSVSEANFRVLLHRSREKFADILVRNVADTIDVADKQSLEEELGQLQLLEYCRPSLDRRSESR